jgi:uncharacterized phage protein gp47/JayE
MFEEMTFESILNRMLTRVPNDIDKRQGSIIYDALAPAAAELAQVYMDLEFLKNRTYADTSVGEDLERRTAERGIKRRRATKAIRKGECFGKNDKPFNVPIGHRFSGDDLNYCVVEKLEDGVFKLECETVGEKGNAYYGDLLSIDYIQGLVKAKLTDILIPGEDAENDKSLRKRYFDTLDSQAFGGNIADYKVKVLGLVGVGGIKVYPVWNGGGTVKLVILDSTFNKPSPTLVQEIQAAIDPIGHQGKGIGFAPIGHVVTVKGVEEKVVQIESLITLQDNYTWEDIKDLVKQALEEYLYELRFEWAEQEKLVLRISQLDTRILNVQGVLDVENTKVNGSAQNLMLSDDEIPVLGEVVAV